MHSMFLSTVKMFVLLSHHPWVEDWIHAIFTDPQYVGSTAAKELC